MVTNLHLKALEPAERMCDLLGRESQIEGDPFSSDTKPLLAPDELQGKIDFEEVSFSYPKDPRTTVLKGLSFSTNPGAENGRRIRSVAFVGETGCGKSTAISLLKRFYAPSKGHIRIDGVPIEQYDPRFLRRSMAIVAQETVLMQVSLRENITFGMCPMPSDKAVIAACKKAAAWAFIQKLPDRLDTIAGKLSGGKKQRISIARALIREPTILLLDEATSALDAVNEREVQKAINRMMDERGAGCSITVAHRLTTIRHSDLIVVMDNGLKVEQGTHDELMQIKVIKDDERDSKVLQGFYHNLWITQQG